MWSLEDTPRGSGTATSTARLPADPAGPPDFDHIYGMDAVVLFAAQPVGGGCGGRRLQPGAGQPPGVRTSAMRGWAGSTRYSGRCLTASSLEGAHISYPQLMPYGLSDLQVDHLPPGTHPARVIRHDGRTLLGITPSGPRVLRPSVRLDPQPAVGDWVAVPAAPTEPAPLVGVLPRTSVLRRLSADENGEQVLAANVDLVLIVCGVDRPIRAGRIQRVAALAWDSGASPVLVITKACLSGDEAVDVPKLELAHPGIRVIVTSALEDVGIEEVRAVIAGRTAVLVGESGAGKSTLTNVLLGRPAAATGAVRDGDAKGRHITSSRQLHLLPGAAGGSIIDTPGIRAVGLTAESDSVEAVFPDIVELAGDCRFSDCQHRSEPGCAVLAAIENGRLPQERYDGWLRLRREAASAAMRSSEHQLRAYGRKFAKMKKTAQLRTRD